MNRSVKTICLLLTLVMCVTAMPLAAVAQDDGTLRIVSSNVLFDDTRDTVYRMHCLAETFARLDADIICLQEARPRQMAALYPLMDDYERVTFIDVQDDLMYQQMLYRKDDFTVVKSGFTRFRDGVIPWGVSWVVFRRNSDGRRFAVMSTHLTIISDTYDKGASNSVEGVQYRKNDCNTILSLITTLRRTYADIPVLVCGDWNAQVGAVELEAIDNSAFMRDAMKVATVSADTKTSTAHKICRMPSANGGDIIDHIYVSVDTLEVLTHQIIADGVVIQGSDHCPVVAQVKFK
ncbi:MAG: endonuclease/exonuclease/phosphatase family protein [Eubacteriales bacterium]|nr:endonuclease/exonuclease/phosphatase family protein [Eubacteriales bacterium]